LSFALILSCEHGGNRVPASFADLFDSKAAAAALAGHRGQDIGALALAEALASRLGVTLFAYSYTRLLIDLNRSIGHASLYSEFSRDLDASARQRLLSQYYEPHRTRVANAIETLVALDQRVLHIAVHSFTPRLTGRTRNADIGLLYDPQRGGERQFCDRWQVALRDSGAQLRVRRNYPYRGTADGFTTYLRRQFSARKYLGIELEVNQSLLGRQPRETAARVAHSLALSAGIPSR
jgi:predicted N-formylglutamate amidohydrolase